MNNKLKIAIVGAGRAGTFHFNNIKNLNLFDLKYVVDLDKLSGLKLTKNTDCEYINDISYFKKNPDSIDCVIIATSTKTHYTLTTFFLNLNIHVFCEKPLGDLDEISECFDLAENKNLKLMIGFQKRFDLNYKTLYENVKEKLNSGEIEQIYNIKTITRDHPLPPIEYLTSCNGIVEDMISHDIDIVGVLKNNQLPLKAVAFSSTNNTKLLKHNLIENIEIILNYSDGTIVNINGSRETKYGYDQRMEVFTNKGLIKLDNVKENTIKYSNIDGNNSGKIKHSFPERYCDSYVNELYYFYNMITNQYPIIVTKKDMIINKIICSVINKSLSTNKVEYFSEYESVIDNLFKKNIYNLRTYNKNTKQYELYKKMYENQTYVYVSKKIQSYWFRDGIKMSIKSVLDSMDEFIDPSDPDLDIPNSIHAFQTAERIRKKHPDNYELQITGLIHDLGKILFKFKEPNWSIVGDTFVLGAAFSDKIVLGELLQHNPDKKNPKYNTKLGLYKEKIGIKNLRLSFGHDEYLYIVLKKNKHHLSDKYLDIIRFHSFYPWHTENEYEYFMCDEDYQTKQNVIEFNKFDLYSKIDSPEITQETKQYYYNLLDKYFPNPMFW